MPLRDTPVGTLGRSVAQILASHAEDQIRARKTSWEAIAANARMSRTQISRLVKGERPINIDQLDLIAAALGLSSSTVLAEADKKASSRPRTPATYPTPDDIVKRGDY